MLCVCVFVCVCVCRKFNKTIEILQGDIEALENEKTAAEKKLDQESKNAMLADTTTTTTRRLRGASFGNALGLRERRSGAEGAGGAPQQGALPSLDGAASPLLLARVCMYRAEGLTLCLCVYVYSSISRDRLCAVFLCFMCAG